MNRCLCSREASRFMRPDDCCHSVVVDARTFPHPCPSFPPSTPPHLCYFLRPWPRHRSRSFQSRFGTETFGKWARADSDLENIFADFPVAFRHPYHNHEVFNLSDSQHVVKKMVNAVSHSDVEGKQRHLGMYWPHPVTGEVSYGEFSLKTLGDAYNHEELRLGGDRPEDQVGEWTRFRTGTSEQVSRSNRTCINVGLSDKVRVWVPPLHPLSLLAPLRVCFVPSAIVTFHQRRPVHTPCLHLAVSVRYRCDDAGVSAASSD